MYRRIEVIASDPDRAFVTARPVGKVGAGFELGDVMHEIGLPAPDVHGPARVKRVRFFFTEAGWREFGRRVLDAAIRRFGVQCVRVVTVKERAVDVVYRDYWQVAARPRK